MATSRQIAANRRNAKKSTGPRTPEGKSGARFNALKTGIDARAQVLPDESAEDLADLAAEYYGHFRPATPDARALVDSLVSSEWQLRRLRRAEPVLWAYAAERCRKYASDPDEPVPNEIGRILDDRAEVFARLQRRIDSAERNYARALKELRRLLAGAANEAEPAQPERGRPELALEPPPGPCQPGPQLPVIQEVPAPVLQIGFVPQTSCIQSNRGIPIPVMTSIGDWQASAHMIPEPGAAPCR